MTYRRAALALPSLALVGAVAACSSSGSGARQPAGAQDATAGSRVANVVVTAAEGCRSDRSSFPAGGITFKIKNRDATAVSEVELLSGERIVGEKENVPPGFSGEFAVNVAAGQYVLYCPGAIPERRPITVTGSSAAPSAGNVAALLDRATAGYADYVETQVSGLLTASERLAAALRGRDLAAAQKAYIAARPFYEK